MYPFRFLYHLKKKVGNKARVEGSICNAYLMEEISNFCSLYFENDVDTKASDLGLNVGQQHINVDASLPEIFSCNLGNGSVKVYAVTLTRRIIMSHIDMSLIIAGCLENMSGIFLTHFSILKSMFSYVKISYFDNIMK